MLRTTSWAVGILFVLAHVAAGQTPEQPPKAPVPSAPAPIAEIPPGSVGLLPLEGERRSPAYYADLDYLLWWVHRGPSPALLTTAPNNGFIPNNNPNVPPLLGGTLGASTTQILFDSHNLTYGSFSALRGKVGVGLGNDGF